MSYTGLTSEQKRFMLQSAGVSNIDELFADVPSEIQVNYIDGLPAPSSEIEIEKLIDKEAPFLNYVPKASTYKCSNR